MTGRNRGKSRGFLPGFPDLAGLTATQWINDGAMIEVTRLIREEDGSTGRCRLRPREISGDSDTSLELFGRDLRATRLCVPQSIIDRTSGGRQ